MLRTSKRLLIQEVEELTTLLRSDPGFADLRDMLSKKGLDPQDLLFAGFLENAEGFQAGALVTPTADLYLFERKDSIRSTRFTKWSRVADSASAAEMYEAVPRGC